MAHDNPTSGHFGIRRTLSQLHKLCYWPEMSKNVDIHCQDCHVCVQTNDPRHFPRAELAHITARGPFEFLALDVMGPLTVSAAGNKYLLVAGDHFSKWLELMHLRDTTALPRLSKHSSEHGVC